MIIKLNKIMKSGLKIFGRPSTTLLCNNAAELLRNATLGITKPTKLPGQVHTQYISCNQDSCTGVMQYDVMMYTHLI